MRVFYKVLKASIRCKINKHKDSCRLQYGLYWHIIKKNIFVFESYGYINPRSDKLYADYINEGCQDCFENAFQ